MNVRAALLACLTVFATAGLAAQHAPSLADLEARARTDSNDPAAHFALAQAWLQAKQQDSARRALETAILIDREFAPAYLLLGRIEGVLLPAPLIAMQANGRIRFVRLPRPGTQDSAALLFRRAFLLDPLQEMYPASSLDMPVAWRGTLEHALREYRLNRLEAAAAIFDTVIMQSDRQHKPVPPVALWYHALSEVGVHQLDTAISDMERLLDRAMRDSTVFGSYASRSVRYVLAFLNQRAGHYQEAERLYRQIVEEDLSVDLAHVQLANIYEAQQRWPEAIQERRNALLVASGDPTLLYDLGVTLLEAGQASEAADTLRRVVILNPRESRASYMLGIAAARLGTYQEARDAFTRFLELAPSRYVDMIADAKARRDHLNASH
jgi:tetratricopeptide (TPR) repeat protein